MSTQTTPTEAIGGGLAVRAAARMLGVTPYGPTAAGACVDLHLDANEAGRSSVDVAAVARELHADAWRRYPDASGLEGAIARRLGVDGSRVLVTAGGDEAIDRACRVFLEPGRQIILPAPTFEMIGRYARLAGAEVVSVPWGKDGFPLAAVLERVNERTAMIAVVSPNNPTGSVASAADLAALSSAAPGAMLLVDLAYTEFADQDLTGPALALPNALVIRTFSKALGLAGARVGYAAGPARVIAWMRGAGSPYPVSGVSVAAAARALEAADEWLPGAVSRVRQERVELASLLRELGARPRESQANFVLGAFDDAPWVWRALGSLGVGVRRFGDGSGLEDSLRITCPGDEAAMSRLRGALHAALRPRALLLDMDGVIADVSRSYRRAIVMTAESFGVRVTAEDVATAKAQGDANNDWVLTQRLVARAGVDAPLAEVTARFERLYHGATRESEGLEASETLIPEAGVLERLATRLPLAIVTGRPRVDCERFLARFGLAGLFSARVCMEDAPAKPDPGAVRLALSRLRVESAWMVGDTPDDVVSARAAGVVPIGVVAPGDAGERMGAALERAGSARVIGSLGELLEMLA